MNKFLALLLLCCFWQDTKVYNVYWHPVPRLSEDFKRATSQDKEHPLPTFTKEWVGHCPKGYEVYTCDGKGCKNTVPSPDPADNKKYECYGWEGPIIGVN